MSNYPIISTGLGKLTPELWSRLMRMLQGYESKKPIAQSDQPGTKKPYFLARITGFQAMSPAQDNKYRYAWEEVVYVSNAAGVVVRTNGMTSGGNQAINLCEIANTAAYVGPAVRIDTAATDYPTTWSMRPIGRTTNSVQLMVVVVMFSVRNNLGGLQYVFSLANAHDGDCE